VRRIASLELAPTGDLTLEQVYALVMQPGVEVRPSRGLVVDAAGTTVMVPLGVFSTDTATRPRINGTTIAWTGSDRSKKIARARFTGPWQIEAGTSLAAAGLALLTSRWSMVEADFGNVQATVGAQVVFDAGSDSDPWAALVTLFDDHGYDLAFDGLGVARAHVVPDPATVDAVFDYGTGESSLVLGGDTQGSMETTYNGIIATGEGTGVPVPVRAEVWDDDPASPTYYLGGFGRAPYFLASPVLTTVDACERAARTRLAKVKGRKEQFAWPAIANPALEPLDVVTVDDGTSTARLVIDKLVVPLLASQPMTAVARTVTVQ
jgi:hypothetical protein